jgi:hypothetical protein
MTYLSLCIKRFDRSTPLSRLGISSTKSEVVKSLNLLASTCSPWVARDWSKANDIDIYYIDNCWVRLPLTADQLRKFNNDILKGEADLSQTLERMASDDGIYVVEAEEY